VLYLDGKLIHKFGTISANQNEIVDKNPLLQSHCFPITKGSEQPLAIRYVIALSHFTRYSSSPTGKKIRLVTPEYADNNEYFSSMKDR
jgi:two-component system NtrC family sensor kinase